MKFKIPGWLIRSKQPLAQGLEDQLRGISRSEWWLWFSATAVTFLCALAFVLLAFPSLFRPSRSIYQVRPEQVTPALIGLLLLFNVHMTCRQWQLRRQRRQLTQPADGSGGQGDEFASSGALDPLTGLPTRRAAEQWLGKEIASSRRQGKPLTVLTLALDGFAGINARHGQGFGDQVLQEYARRLKRASRGSDLVVRMGTDEFLLILPECGMQEAQRLLDRVNPVTLECQGQELTLSSTAAWIDHQAGETPGEMLKRASQMLQLYKAADQDASAPAAQVL